MALLRLDSLVSKLRSKGSCDLYLILDGLDLVGGGPGPPPLGKTYFGFSQENINRLKNMGGGPNDPMLV